MILPRWYGYGCDLVRFGVQGMNASAAYRGRQRSSLRVRLMAGFSLWAFGLLLPVLVFWLGAWFLWLCVRLLFGVTGAAIVVVTWTAMRVREHYDGADYSV